jgi:hypothetical protein
MHVCVCVCGGGALLRLQLHSVLDALLLQAGPLLDLSQLLVVAAGQSGRVAGGR